VLCVIVADMTKVTTASLAGPVLVLTLVCHQRLGFVITNDHNVADGAAE
jgi:hypothetical protein